MPTIPAAAIVALGLVVGAAVGAWFFRRNPLSIAFHGALVASAAAGLRLWAESQPDPHAGVIATIGLAFIAFVTLIAGAALRRNAGVALALAATGVGVAAAALASLLHALEPVWIPGASALSIPLEIAILLAFVLFLWNLRTERRARIDAWNRGWALPPPVPSEHRDDRIAILAVAGGAALALLPLYFSHDSRPWSPLTIWLAALCWLGVGHCSAWRLAGAGGLALAALGVIIATGQWFLAGWQGVTLGSALAGLWLLWLARFWQQQLLIDPPYSPRAWTTAGALIPAARILASLCAVAVAVAAFTCLANGVVGPTAAAWRIGVATTLPFLFAFFLVRDSGQHQTAIGAAAAWFALLGAIPATVELCARTWGFALDPAGVAAALALLLAIRIRFARGHAVFAAIHRAYIMGALPALVVLAAVLRGVDAQTPAMVVLTAAAVLVARRTVADRADVSQT